MCKRNDGGGGSDGGATEEAEEEEEEEEPGVSDQKQKPHTKMWGITTGYSFTAQQNAEKSFSWPLLKWTVAVGFPNHHVGKPWENDGKTMGKPWETIYNGS